MESARLTQRVESRTQVEMIGVAKYYLCLHLLTEFAEMHTLHRPTCAHGHEDGRLYLSVRRGDDAGTCIAARVGVLKLESQCHVCLRVGMFVVVIGVVADFVVFVVVFDIELHGVVYRLAGEGKLPHVLHVFNVVERHAL